MIVSTAARRPDSKIFGRPGDAQIVGVVADLAGPRVDSSGIRAIHP